MNTLHAHNGGMQESLWLPPQDARQWDIEKQGKIETPLDVRGVVDLDELVAVGRETVSGNFNWASPFNDVHHLQWPAAFYMQNADETDHQFRELVGRKAYVPRRFHNWLHLIALPPPIPSGEVIHYSIDAEQKAKAVAGTAKLAMQLTRMKGIPKAKLIKRLEEEFEHYTMYVENARLVPAEFQLLKFEEVEAKSIDEMLNVNKHLGKMALHQIPRRLRSLQPAA